MKIETHEQFTALIINEVRAAYHDATGRSDAVPAMIINVCGTAVLNILSELTECPETLTAVPLDQRIKWMFERIQGRL